MVKSPVELLATNKNFHKGVLTGMLIAHKVHKKKKYSGKGWSFGDTLGVLAGPAGWIYLTGKKIQEAKEKKKEKKKQEEIKKHKGEHSAPKEDEAVFKEGFEPDSDEEEIFKEGFDLD